MKNIKKIIAVGRHPGSINSIIPVIKKLKKKNRIEVRTIGQEYSEKILAENNLDYKTISFYDLKDVSVKSMERLLQMESPQAVLTGTSTQDKDNKDVIEQTITLAAREKKIKSVSVLDYWGCYSERFSDMYSEEKFKFLPDKIAIMDKLAEGAMLKEGFKREKLVITGNPDFDDLIKSKNKFSKKNKEKVREDLELDANSYLILYASQPLEFHYGKDNSNPKFLGYTEKTALQDLIESITKLKNKKNISILVRAHPRENKEDLENVVKNCRAYNLEIRINQDYPLKPVLLTADAIFSPFSTVLVKSSYLGKPSMSIQPGLKDIKKDMLITNSMGVTVPIYRKEEIVGVVEKLLFDRGYYKELAEKRKDFKTDGKATQRVTNLLLRMIE